MRFEKIVFLSFFFISERVEERERDGIPWKFDIVKDDKWSVDSLYGSVVKSWLHLIGSQSRRRVGTCDSSVT